MAVPDVKQDIELSNYVDGNFFINSQNLNSLGRKALYNELNSTGLLKNKFVNTPVLDKSTGEVLGYEAFEQSIDDKGNLVQRNLNLGVSDDPFDATPWINRGIIKDPDYFKGGVPSVIMGEKEDQWGAYQGVTEVRPDAGLAAIDLNYLKSKGYVSKDFGVRREPPDDDTGTYARPLPRARDDMEDPLEGLNIQQLQKHYVDGSLSRLDIARSLEKRRGQKNFKDPDYILHLWNRKVTEQAGKTLGEGQTWEQMYGGLGAGERSAFETGPVFRPDQAPFYRELTEESYSNPLFVSSLENLAPEEYPDPDPEPPKEFTRRTRPAEILNIPFEVRAAWGADPDDNQFRWGATGIPGYENNALYPYGIESRESRLRNLMSVDEWEEAARNRTLADAMLPTMPVGTGDRVIPPLPKVLSNQEELMKFFGLAPTSWETDQMLSEYGAGIAFGRPNVVADTVKPSFFAASDDRVSPSINRSQISDLPDVPSFSFAPSATLTEDQVVNLLKPTSTVAGPLGTGVDYTPDTAVTVNPVQALMQDATVNYPLQDIMNNQAVIDNRGTNGVRLETTGGDDTMTMADFIRDVESQTYGGRGETFNRLMARGGYNRYLNPQARAAITSQFVPLSSQYLMASAPTAAGGYSGYQPGLGQAGDMSFRAFLTGGAPSYGVAPDPQGTSAYGAPGGGQFFNAGDQLGVSTSLGGAGGVTPWGQGQWRQRIGELFPGGSTPGVGTSAANFLSVLSPEEAEGIIRSAATAGVNPIAQRYMSDVVANAVRRYRDANPAASASEMLRAYGPANQFNLRTFGMPA